MADLDAAAIVDAHLADLDPAWRSTSKRVIGVILDELPDAQHERKWGRLTFTRGDDWHHWICAIAPSEKTLKLVIHKGVLLDDQWGAMEGTGRYTRSISFRAPEEVDPGVLGPLLRQAADRQTEMLP
jgi:hypothetical protein